MAVEDSSTQKIKQSRQFLTPTPGINPNTNPDVLVK